MGSNNETDESKSVALAFGIFFRMCGIFRGYVLPY